MGQGVVEASGVWRVIIWLVAIFVVGDIENGAS